MARKPSKPPLPEGQRPQKRERKAKRVATPPKTPTFNATYKLSPGVPDNVKTAMATALMAHSLMDATLDWLIWDAVGLSFDDGRLLTSTVELRDKIEIGKRLAKRYELPLPQVPVNALGLWTVMGDVSTARNMMAHGVWQMYELHIPMVSSFRLNDPGGEDRVVVEKFEIPRIEAVTRQCEWARGHLQTMLKAVPALRKKRAEQPRGHDWS